MRVGLLVNKISPDREENLKLIRHMVGEVAESGVQFLLLPEAALTGLINNDDPNHDLILGEPIPGAVTDTLGALCSQYRIWLGIGLLEREGHRLYDSVVLIDPQGRIALKYRRNNSQWHGPCADPAVYCEGKDVARADTPFGAVAFLICGDLFDDGILSRFKALKPDWLLMPFARCFSDGSIDQHRWDTQELPEYLARVKQAETPALMVNYLADSRLADGNSFGGAFVISEQGELLASYPLGKEGILVIDVEENRNLIDITEQAPIERNNQTPR